MKELVFHSGLPKTGSSALQVFFARNRDALLLQGFDYLPLGEFAEGARGMISSGNGAYLARCLFPRGSDARVDDPGPQFRAFFAAVAGSEAAAGLVSSELFAHTDPVLLAGFLAMVRDQGLRPKVFYFVRAQDRFLMSNYVQMVKRHRFTGAPDAFALETMGTVPFLRYDAYFHMLSELFGKDNLIVRIYDEVPARDRGLFLTTLEALGIDAAPLAFETAEINTGLSGAALALMLALNRFKPRIQFSDLVVQTAQLAGLSKAGDVHALLRPDTLAAIEAFFRNENCLFAQAYFDRRALFPAQATRAVQALDTTAPADRDLIVFLGGLVVRMEERIYQLEEMVDQLTKKI
jgi:hypothetical protein